MFIGKIFFVTDICILLPLGETIIYGGGNCEHEKIISRKQGIKKKFDGVS